jgi:hypothetical protein
VPLAVFSTRVATVLRLCFVQFFEALQVKPVVAG